MVVKRPSDGAAGGRAAVASLHNAWENAVDIDGRINPQ